MTKLQQGGNYETPLVDRGKRGGTVIRIVLLALVLIGVAIALSFSSMRWITKSCSGCSAFWRWSASSFWCRR